MKTLQSVLYKHSTEMKHKNKNHEWIQLLNHKKAAIYSKMGGLGYY